MTDSQPGSIWAKGEPYERYVGRWSRVVAREFVRDLGLPHSLAWLDLGCGTGALTSAILTLALPKSVVGVEPAEGFLAVARRQLREGVQFQQGSATSIPVGDATMDVVASALVLNFVQDLPAAMAEMKRVVRPHGIIAAYVWDYAEGMELMRHFWDAAVALRPESRDQDEALRFPLCRPAALAEAFDRAGLVDVAVAPITVDTPYRDFDEYWAPFMDGQGPAPAYACALPETSQIQLRERLRSRLPTQPDGSIQLRARAWAVKGRRVR